MKRPSPALIVSIVALIVALGGTGYAALKLPSNSVGAKQIKRNAVTSPKVKNGSLLKSDFKAGQLPAGARGPQGAKGEKGDKGDAGLNGTNGTNGTPGPLVDTLPSGKTLRGIYAMGTHASGPSHYISGAISFPFPLASAPTPHVIGDGQTPPAECPGNEGNPQAAAGHLCVYEASKLNTSGPPETCDPTSGCPSVNRHGVGIQIFAAGAGVFNSSGTWAVTAP